MVDQVDLDDAPGLREPLRDPPVGFAWNGFAAYTVCGISGVMPNAVLCRTEVAIPLANRSPMRRKKGEAGEL